MSILFWLSERLDTYCLRRLGKLDVIPCAGESSSFFSTKDGLMQSQKKYPNSRLVGLSNSHSQRTYIMSRANDSNLANVEASPSWHINYTTR